VQTNSYQGTPSRAWLKVQLVALDGEQLELNLLADTGNPFALIIPDQALTDFKHRDGPSADTNFGPLRGGLLCVSVPELRENLMMASYGSDAVAKAARTSHPDLDGLVGLPFLREFRYGGDGHKFWIA
jgi:hypothetical protein